jgi:MFS family permease
LGHRDFRLYFAGVTASNLGTWMQNTAQVLLVYRLTHSVFAVGLVTGAQFAGSLILAPWAAVVARHFGGKATVIAAQAFSAVIAGYMAVQQVRGSLGEKDLIVGALGLGLILAFALPVQTALVPRLVPEKRPAVEAAIAMNSASYNVGRALAPVVSVVVVIVTNGFAWAFAANAISFVIYAVLLVRLRPRPTTQTSGRTRAADGVRVAFKHPRVMLLLAMVAVVTFADDPVLIQGPAVAQSLHISADWPGYFLTALGLGTIVGALWPARRSEGWDPSGTSRRAAWSLVWLFICIVIFAAGIEWWASLIAAFFAGVAVFNTGALAQTQLTRHRPEHMASVMALWAIAWAGTKPLASLLDGWLASHLYLWLAAAIVATPALVLGLLEIFLSQETKKSVKDSWKQWAADWPAPAASSLREPETVQ